MNKLERKRTRRPRRRLEGMTLVEIMIVVIIMALIATGVAVAVIPRLREAKVNTTRTDLGVLRSAAEQYYMAHNDCPPNLQALVPDYLSSSGHQVDAWNNPFTIECDGTEVIVTSGGPDGQTGTEDDIR